MGFTQGFSLTAAGGLVQRKVNIALASSTLYRVSMVSTKTGYGLVGHRRKFLTRNIRRTKALYATGIQVVSTLYAYIRPKCILGYSVGIVIWSRRSREDGDGYTVSANRYIVVLFLRNSMVTQTATKFHVEHPESTGFLLPIVVITETYR